MRVPACIIAFLFLVHSAWAQAKWFPFTLPWDDDSKTILDASDLLVDYDGQDPSQVIDARGFVRAGADGHFYFEKTSKRARFWGVNFVFNASFPPCPDEPLRSGEYPDTRAAEKVARRLAKLGINVVRFHHMDSGRSPGGIFDPAFYPNDTQHLDAGQIKRLDYLISQLRRNGIYVNLNLKVSRRFGKGDGLEDTGLFAGNLNYFQGVSHYNPRMIELQKDYARQLLTHKNPYTGKTYAEDPALLCVEIANEDTLFGNLQNDGGLNYLPAVPNSLPKLYSDELDRLWNDWLKSRFGTQPALAAAWKYSGSTADTSDRIRNGGFESGLTNWTVQRIDPAQASWRVENASGPDGSTALRVDVTADGVNWHVQAFQNGHGIEKDGLYEITFYARSSSPGEIGLDVMKGVPDYRNYGLGATFQLTANWTKYRASFHGNETDSTTVRPTFELGTRNNSIWLDQVEFRRVLPRDLDPSEDLSAGTVARLYRTQFGSYTDARLRDLFRFYSETDEKYFTGMRTYVKNDLGVKALVTGTAPWWAYLGDIAVQSKMDFVDGHYYWDHPSWVGIPAWSPTGWVIRNTPLVNSLEDLSTLPSIAVRGKPFTVSEYNEVFPNRYALEGPLLLALVANLQDWDGVYLFDYADNTEAYDNAVTTSFFSMAGNPVKSAQLPIAARMFLRSQSSPATESIDVDLTPDELAQGYAQGLINAGRYLAGKGLDRRAFLRARLRIRSFDQETSKPIDYVLASGSVESSNLELRWERQDTAASFLRVKGSAVQGAIGFLKGRTEDFGDWAVEFSSDGPDHLAALLQARDASSLRETRRMLFTVWTEHQNTNMGWNATQTSVDNRWGQAPTIVKPARLKLSLRFGPTNALRMFALDEKGYRKAALSGQSNGGSVQFDVDTGRDQTVWYEVEINDAASITDCTISPTDLFQMYSDAGSNPLQVGWIEIDRTSGSLPRIVPLLEYKSRGILTSMVRVPVGAPSTMTTIPVFRDKTVSTAVALLNPQSTSLQISMRLRDASGTSVGEPRNENLQSGETKAFFLNERFSMGAEFLGSLELQGAQSFHTLALRSTTNDTGDLFYTPIPTRGGGSRGPLYFVHLVADESYSSEILLLNSQAQVSTTLLEFFTAGGGAATRPSPATITLAPGEVRRLLIPRGPASFSGYARWTLLAGAQLPPAVAVITRWENGSPKSEVGILPVNISVEQRSVIPERPAQYGALALMNPGAAAITVDLELKNAEPSIGASRRAQVTLKPGAKSSFFLYEVFKDLPTFFTAELRISAGVPIASLSLLGLYNSRGDFLMASLDAEVGESEDAAAKVAIVPRFVTGEGYRSLLFLLPPSQGSASVQIRFFDSMGIPMSVRYR